MNATMTYHTFDAARVDVSIAPIRDDDPYTDSPTHVRIYREETGDAWPWHIDGINAADGRYTEAVNRFGSRADAVANLPAFVAEVTGRCVVCHGELDVRDADEYWRCEPCHDADLGNVGDWTEAAR